MAKAKTKPAATAKPAVGELVEAAPAWAIRFWEKVQRSLGGCWLWTASVGSHGYGQFTPDGRGSQKLAHRIAYELLVGPIVPRMTLDHLCRCRRCVNPAHLEVVSLDENKRRGFSPAAVNARKTHCKHGHLLAEGNLIHRKRSGRDCLTCQRNRQAKLKERKAPPKPMKACL
jgi:hypothetical protein